MYMAFFERDALVWGLTGKGTHAETAPLLKPARA